MTNRPSINWDFIRTLEGFKLQGYVPVDKDIGGTHNSGVTIVGGFDIGQHNIEELKMLNLPDSLLTKLTPYCGLTGDAARYALSQTPLTLTYLEGDQLDIAVKQMAVNNCMVEYDSNSKIDFCSLSTPIQTVIMSVSFQYGSLKKATPHFFEAVTQGDWNSAYEQLLNFGDNYQSRRTQEAAYLKSALEEKPL